jgi:hypothetical protein
MTMTPTRSRTTTLFFVKLNRFLRVASRKARHLDAEEFVLAEWRETVADTVGGGHAVLNRAWRAYVALGEDEKDRMDRVIEDSGVMPVLDSCTRVLERGSPLKQILQLIGSIIIGIGEALDVESVPLSAVIAGLLKLLGHTLADVGIFLNDQMIERLEAKLDFIMDLPKGWEIPHVPEHSLPVSLTEIKGLLTGLIQATAFIMDLPTGEDVPPPPAPGSRIQPVSLTEIKVLITTLIELTAFAIDLPEGEPIPPRPPAGTLPVSLTNIEQKLDFIMDLPEGTSTPSPPPADSGLQPVSLTLLKQKLDNLADRLGEILTGQPIPIEPTDTVDRTPHPIKTEIIELERKLDFIMDLPSGQDTPAPPDPAAGVRPVSLTEIRKALAFIMDLPRDQEVPEPPDPASGIQPVSLTEIKVLITILIELIAFAIDLPRDTPIPPRPPAGTLPVSLTDIEKKLDFIMDFPPGEGRQIPPVPPGVTPVSLTQIHGTTKKIYVAEEDDFTPSGPGDARLIAIRAPAPPPNVRITPAFDVSGWIDLSEMRDGDAVTIRVDVSFAGRPAVRFNQITFSDAQAKPLKHFRDFADGVEAVVGTSVDITISQRVSADNFASLVTTAYQFIVESA